MNRKVLLTAAAAALLVIAMPRPAAKAMIPVGPLLDQDGATVVQVGKRGGGGGFRGGGREWRFGGGARAPSIGGGGFRALPAPRSYGWSGGRSRGFSRPYVGGHAFRDNGGRHVFRGERPRSWARDFNGGRHFFERGKVFDHRKFDGDRKKFFAGRDFDDGKFRFRKFDDHRTKFFADRKFDDGKFGFRKFDDHRKKFFADRKFDDDRFFHKHRRALFFVGPLFDFDNGYNGCEWLRWKAIQTGSPYWWRRYEWCRNGWDW